MNYEFQNEVEPWSCFIFVLETSEKLESRSTGNFFPLSLQLSFLELHTHFSIFTFQPGPISKCEAEEFLHSYICETQTELKGLASFPPLFLPDSLLSSQCTIEIGDHLGFLTLKKLRRNLYHS